MLSWKTARERKDKERNVRWLNAWRKAQRKLGRVTKPKQKTAFWRPSQVNLRLSSRSDFSWSREEKSAMDILPSARTSSPDLSLYVFFVSRFSEPWTLSTPTTFHEEKFQAGPPRDKAAERQKTKEQRKKVKRKGSREENMKSRKDKEGKK